MSICPYVKDRCCSFSDEIKILKLYNSRTLPLMSQHADQSMSLLKSILNLFDEVRQLDPMLFNIRFKKMKRLEYD